MDENSVNPQGHYVILLKEKQHSDLNHQSALQMEISEIPQGALANTRK